MKWQLLFKNSNKYGSMKGKTELVGQCVMPCNRTVIFTVVLNDMLILNLVSSAIRPIVDSILGPTILSLDRVILSCPIVPTC